MSVGTPVVIVTAAPATPVIISGIAPNTALTIKVTSTAAFTVDDASGTQIFNVDTQTPLVQVGNDTTSVPLKLDGPSASPSRLQFYRAGAIDWQIGLIANSDDLRIQANTTAILDINVTSGVFERYAKVATAGWGVPAIYASGRSTAQTAAVASIATYTVGAADGSFEVTSELEVTASTTFSIQVQVSYTDPTNAAATLILGLYQSNGAALTTVTNTQGVGNYAGRMARIRCKAGTAITVATIGTFTTVTYNVEAMIAQVA